MPTDGFIVWDGSWAIHHDPELWHKPDEFLPERFLTTDHQDPLYAPPNALRSLEAGPQNCIGQHLAIVEIKLAVVLVARCLILRSHGRNGIESSKFFQTAYY